MWRRIKTAIILVIIVAVAMFASDTPYLLIPLLALGVTIAAHEWTKLMPKWNIPILFVALVLIITMLTLLVPESWPAWWCASIAIWLMAIIWVAKFPESTRWYGNRMSVIGMVILTSSITAMFYLWQQSPWWLLYVFILVWCADSGAYFVGRKLGKHPMSPKVSPNKTIEGLVGGLLTGLAVVLGIGLYKLKLSGNVLALFVGLSLITILASVLGDLFESMLKRRAGVKDSGTILPGHGGVLDRIDSLLSATPVFALSYWFIYQSGFFAA